MRKSFFFVLCSLFVFLFGGCENSSAETSVYMHTTDFYAYAAVEAYLNKNIDFTDSVDNRISSFYCFLNNIDGEGKTKYPNQWIENGSIEYTNNTVTCTFMSIHENTSHIEWFFYDDRILEIKYNDSWSNPDRIAYKYEYEAVNIH